MTLQVESMRACHVANFHNITHSKQKPESLYGIDLWLYSEDAMNTLKHVNGATYIVPMISQMFFKCNPEVKNVSRSITIKSKYEVKNKGG